LWQSGLADWSRKDYLQAMQGFQSSLNPCQKSWELFLSEQEQQAHQQSLNNSNNIDDITTDNSRSSSSNNNSDAEEDDEDLQQGHSFALVLARRLLFCAYCELDAGDRISIQSARQRLVQSISILLVLTLSFHNNQNPQPQMQYKQREQAQEILNDAWMELMLSMEEVPQHLLLARHVVHMAIMASCDRGVSNSNNSNSNKRISAICGWTHPLQRPGYMAPQLETLPFIPPEQHPPWCRILEDHWRDTILKEYSDHTRRSLAGILSPVGSGARGSGHDDFRVVVQGDWKEYVLFGTGSSNNNSSNKSSATYGGGDGGEAKEKDGLFPLTKRLIATHVPDAVSLAEQGGGEVILSRLAPHTRIQAHCGPTNLRWTAHLALVLPPTSNESTKAGQKCQCRIRVGNQWHSWHIGKVLLFDDSFEHEVHNDTNHERLVLLLRLWNPNLPTQQRDAYLREALANKQSAIEKRYHPPN